MTDDGFKLNASKTKCMLIHSSRAKCSPSLNLHLSDKVIEQMRTFKFLGVYINNTLPWKDHVDKVISNLLRKINLLKCTLLVFSLIPSCPLPKVICLAKF
jgi:hypothetical protein